MENRCHPVKRGAFGLAGLIELVLQTFFETGLQIFLAMPHDSILLTDKHENNSQYLRYDNGQIFQIENHPY